jgi:hypothetical protein
VPTDRFDVAKAARPYPSMGTLPRRVVTEQASVGHSSNATTPEGELESEGALVATTTARKVVDLVTGDGLGATVRLVMVVSV